MISCVSVGYRTCKDKVKCYRFPNVVKFDISSRLFTVEYIVGRSKYVKCFDLSCVLYVNFLHDEYNCEELLISEHKIFQLPDEVIRPDLKELNDEN